MKANYLKLFLVITLCLTIGSVEAQGLKSVLDKAKNALDEVGNKVKGDKNDSEETVSAIAKPIAPDVKNSVSEIRSLTGLSEVDFEKKVKSMGFIKSTDETGFFGDQTIYKSKSKDYYIGIIMGTRGGELLTIEVSRISYKKNPVLTTMKSNFLNLAKQCTDLKAEFIDADINESGKIIGGVRAKNLSTRSSKFLPALDTMINSKKEFNAMERYEERDYEYRVSFMNINAIETGIVTVTVVDKTVDSQFG